MRASTFRPVHTMLSRYEGGTAPVRVPTGGVQSLQGGRRTGCFENGYPYAGSNRFAASTASGMSRATATAPSA